jgi:hypothetical protein
MTITLRKAIVGLAAAVSLTLAGAAPALASTGPGNAPTAVTGTFGCTNGWGGTYVINAGNSNVQTWDAAILTFTSGRTGTGVFIQTASALSVNGIPQNPPPVFKGTERLGPVQCSIQTTDGTVTGTVWGKIVTTG